MARKTALGKAFDSSLPNPGRPPATTMAGALDGAFRRSKATGSRPSLERTGTYDKAPDGGTLFTNTQKGNKREGAKFASIRRGGEKFHVYYSPDGARDVVRVGKPRLPKPSVSAAGSRPQKTT